MNKKTHNCIGCDGLAGILLDFGPQPPSNRFLKEGERDSDVHPLVLGQCSACGLMQLIDPMPVDMVRSRFSWLTYNEPEGHLDSLVQKLGQLPGIDSKSVIGGLTFKDDSTIARLNRRGFSETFRLDCSLDFGLEDPAAGLESIQRAVTASTMKEIAARHGKVDIFLARHVLEHAHAPRTFLLSLMELIKPGGYLVLEMPDSTKFLDALSYAFVWEEHISYFVPSILKAFLEMNGFGAVEILTYPYALEDSLVAIVKIDDTQAHSPESFLSRELARAQLYAKSYKGVRDQINSQFARFRSEGKKIAVFGAGHMTVRFLNFFELGRYIDYVLDDNPGKQDMLMPGSGIRIRGSSLLRSEKIDLCLLSMSPESEGNVIAAHQDYIGRSGDFRSIFSLSSLALK